MQLNLERPTQPNIIRSVSAGAQSCRIFVGETALTQSLIITPESIDLWEVTKISQLEARHFEQLSQLSVEVVVLGTGTTIEFPLPGLTQALMSNHIGLEVMDTAAACRTYNILANDGRKVAAALMLW
ncbi:MAG: Mth938-like domain-containing protein [bacterium]